MGVIASLLAVRIRLPALVVFLAIGMAIGSDGAGWLDFDDYELARLIGSIALALILFEGGLAAGFHEIRPALRPAIGLALVGTAVTAAITGLAATWLFDFPLLEGLLLGAILSPTDGAAVFAAMRGSKLPRRLVRTLEGEAGFNDPVAVLLVLVMIELIQQPSYNGLDVGVFFLQELVIGAAVGVALGWLAIKGLRRASAAPDGLQLVGSFATAALAFGLAGTLGGSGFLAVYIAGLMLGATPLPAKRSIVAFHDGLASVAEMGMFFTLGLLVFPSQLGDVFIEGTLLAFVVAFLARPVAAALATSVDRFSGAERLVLGWAGLRGAVPVVLATFPVIAGIPHSLEFFNIVFFAVLVSTAFQGATLEALAKALGVGRPRPGEAGEPASA